MKRAEKTVLILPDDRQDDWAAIASVMWYNFISVYTPQVASSDLGGAQRMK